MIKSSELLGTLEPSFGIKLHRFRKDGGVTVHHPGRHTDDNACRQEAVVKCCARIGNDARETAYDAEGEAEAFFGYCCLRECVSTCYIGAVS